MLFRSPPFMLSQSPQMRSTAGVRVRMHGYSCGYRIVWDEINLQDEVEEARAALYAQQARKLQIENDAAEKKGAYQA